MHKSPSIPLKRLALLYLSVAVAPGAAAQSTLGDPVPIGDPAGSSIARTAAINGAMNSSDGPSDAELARRRAHGDQLSACNTQARNTYPAGSDGRKAARAACQETFQALKATWYDPKYQVK